MNKPTCEELFDEELGDPVHRKSDDGWRHGCHITEVYHREEDDTYWEATYSLSIDGETHGLREGMATIQQVRPESKTIIEYVPM